MSDLTKSPCQRLDCQRCCYETEMTLTEEDLRRIGALGYKDYYGPKDGYLQMKNIDGKCFFLREGFCLIHSDKPIGCKLYPQVLDIDRWVVMLHDFCHYTEEFHFDREDGRRLKETIKTEERERRLRVAGKKKKHRSNKP